MSNHNRFYLFAAVLILALITLFYWGIHSNYFYMDDFHWLARAINSQHSIQDIFTIEGRDFNPVFLILLSTLIKISGLSVLVMRAVSVLIFAGLTFTFFHLLCRYFNIHRLVALIAVLMFALNVFVSEALLNFSAMVYSLALLLALWAMIFFLKRKRVLFLVFMIAACLTKETILLVILPLIVYEKENSNRLFLAFSGAGLLVFRVLLQLTAATSSYTSFMETRNFLHKLYFLLLRSLNLSPYAIPLILGIVLLLSVLAGGGYFAWKKRQRGLWFFLSMFFVYALLFAVLPKLSSRYVLFPSLGFWGAAVIAVHYFRQTKHKKILEWTLVPILLVTFLFNLVLIRKEVQDYRLLGDFSRTFILEQANHIKSAVYDETSELFLLKGDMHRLAELYKLLHHRGHMPKLLPFRAHSIEGVIEPRHLIPIIYYPSRLAVWQLKEETKDWFKGHIIFNLN